MSRIGGARRHHLVEGLVARDHAEVTAGAFLERIHAGLKIAPLGRQLLVALGELLVLRALRRYRLAQPPDITHAVLREPHPVLQQDDDDTKSCSEPLHGPDSLADVRCRAKSSGFA